MLVGGSATTTVSLKRGRRDQFTYAELSSKDIRGWIARLAKTSLDQRRALDSMNPQRADILLGGLVIVESFMRLSKHTTALVSGGDVLLG